ncbi:DxFTY motif-containing membrane protein [Spiroplasma endosymbiont of Atherix ibis]|uniref:DxFTY motif-containing membrane protein n=1 Tax=Spiroplasma endosymbiont of Atherix ibis TaxID=3066291 RepID=UPI0030D225B2
MKTNIFKDFNELRTPFFRSFLFLLIESILPGLIIWLTVGFDFNFTLNNKLPYPKVGYVALICIVYFIYTFLLTYIFYKLKWHEVDHFTFAFLITLILICIIMFGSFMSNHNLWILIKFISISLIVVLLTPLIVFITALIRNNNLKKQEEFEKIYEAYKNGEIIPSNKLLKAQRYQKYLIKKETKKAELEIFKKKLDQKFKLELENQEQKQDLKKQKIISKLDKKEQKQREKQKD